MAPDKTTIAKISRPKVSGIQERKRLFRLLDDPGSQVLWVGGPAGSGKTTLVASWLDTRKLPCLWYQLDEGDADIASFFYYLGLAARKAAPRYRKPLPLLTPEYLLDIPTFTRRFFEELYGRFASPRSRRKGAVLIFDNYQTVTPDSIFHEVIRNGLSLIPEGIRCIVISRGEPPQTFARIRASDRMRRIGWDELRFTLEESRAMVKRRGRGIATDSALELLHEKTEGWAAGLVLMTESARTGDIDEETLRNIEPRGIFDYFAAEIFDKIDKETQEFLLKTAVLPQVEPLVAGRLTGAGGAHRILSGLASNHFFTTKRQNEQAYEYHALFREFLISRAEKTFTDEELNGIRKRAAGLLEDSGQIENAASLFRDAKDWNGLVQVILRQARTLAMQGRSATLEGWLDAVPNEITGAVSVAFVLEGRLPPALRAIRGKTVFSAGVPRVPGAERRGGDAAFLVLHRRYLSL